MAIAGGYATLNFTSPPGIELPAVDCRSVAHGLDALPTAQPMQDFGTSKFHRKINSG
jgi:hypothetical protein